MLMICAVDAIGQHGVQMFVDAGRPVDDTLVAALIRDVLAEKIAAMLGERAELDRLARREQESRQLPVPTAANSGISQTSHVSKFLCINIYVDKLLSLSSSQSLSLSTFFLSSSPEYLNY